MIKVIENIEKVRAEAWEIIEKVDLDNIESIKDETTSIGIEIKENEYMKTITRVKKEYPIMIYKDFSKEEEEMKKYLALLKYEKAFYTRIAKKQLKK